MKSCPFCAEDIQDAAIVCRFCQRSLTAASVPAPVPAAPVSAEPVSAPPISTAPVCVAPITWSPGAAAVLSAVIPGMGQVYKGRLGLGVGFFLAAVAAYSTLVIPGLVVHGFAIRNAYKGKIRGRAKPPKARRPVAAAPKPPEAPTPKTATKPRNTRVLAIAGALALFAMAVASIVPAEPSRSRRASATAATSATLTLDDAERLEAVADSDALAARLRGIVLAGGNRCRAVTRTFHQGRKPKEEDDFWNVRCAGSETYAITILPGADPRVLSCPALKAVAGIECFRTFENQ